MCNNLSRILSLLVLACLLAGCADSAAIITGTVRPATTPDKVRVFFEPPKGKYDTIGLVSASSKGRGGFTRQGKTDAAIRTVREKAAEIGANGVIIGQQGTSQTSGVATSAGGVVMVNSFSEVEMSGTAIYLP